LTDESICIVRELGATSFQIIDSFSPTKIGAGLCCGKFPTRRSGAIVLISHLKVDMDEHLRIGTGCVSERVLWQLQDDDLEPFRGLRYLIWAPETRRGGDEQDYRRGTQSAICTLWKKRAISSGKTATVTQPQTYLGRWDRRWIATADLFF
jgi:hypothetical protein